MEVYYFMGIIILIFRNFSMKNMLKKKKLEMHYVASNIVFTLCVYIQTDKTTLFIPCISAPGPIYTYSFLKDKHPITKIYNEEIQFTSEGIQKFSSVQLFSSIVDIIMYL